MRNQDPVFLLGWQNTSTFLATTQRISVRHRSNFGWMLFLTPPTMTVMGFEPMTYSSPAMGSTTEPLMLPFIFINDDCIILLLMHG